MGRSPEYQPYLFSPDVQVELSPAQADILAASQRPLFSDATEHAQPEEIELHTMTVILAPPNRRELKKKGHWSCLVATERDDTTLYLLRAPRTKQEQALNTRLHPGDVINAKGQLTATAQARIQGITYQTKILLLTDLSVKARAKTLKPQ